MNWGGSYSLVWGGELGPRHLVWGKEELGGVLLPGTGGSWVPLTWCGVRGELGGGSYYLVWEGELGPCPLLWGEGGAGGVLLPGTGAGGEGLGACPLVWGSWVPLT